MPKFEDSLKSATMITIICQRGYENRAEGMAQSMGRNKIRKELLQSSHWN